MTKKIVPGATRSGSGPRIKNPVKGVETEALQLSNKFSALDIIDQQTYDGAVAARGQLKNFLDSVEAVFEPMRERTYAAYREVIDQRDKIRRPAQQLLSGINEKLAVYSDQQDQLRRRQKQEAVDQSQREAEKIRALEIERLRKKGYDSESLAALASSPLVAAPIIAVEGEHDRGDLSLRATYTGEVTNFFELVKFVAKNKALIHLIQPNQAEINKIARAQRDALEVPGIRPVRKVGVAGKKG